VTITATRLARQRIDPPVKAAPRDVVAWFGAMQAQDYYAAQWALGLRVKGATEKSIEDALTDGSVIRTHAFRGTWQYIAREDVRWILALVGSRVIARSASRYRELGLADRTLGRCCELFAKALAGGKQLTRAEMAAVLARGKIDCSEQRLMHILGHAELSGVICSGARRGKQATFALLDERIPAAPAMSRDEALAELARRYVQSRGPVTIDDFMWWTGLPKRELQAALASVRETAVTPRRSTGVHLLPTFDEYLVGYRDRSAMVDARHVLKVNAGGGILKPAVVVDGKVIGIWRRELARDEVSVTATLFEKSTARTRDAIAEAAEGYGAFLALRTAFHCSHTSSGSRSA
jgi:hypothetical protein